MLSTVAIHAARNSRRSGGAGGGAEGSKAIRRGNTCSQCRRTNGPEDRLPPGILRAVAAHEVPIEACEIRLTGIVIPIGLRVDEVTVSGERLTAYDAEPWLELSESAHLNVVVSQESVAAFLEKRAPAGLSKFRVEAEDGMLKVHAVKRILIEVPATALCRLVIRDGREIHVELESVEVMGGASLTELVRSQIDAINPILDVDDLPLPMDLHLTSVETNEGRILVRGVAEKPS